MKILKFFVFTFLLTILVGLPQVFAQDTSPEYIVRVLYVVPNDREPDPDMDTQLDTLMKEAQQFYAGLMEFHGFSRKTFRLETDATGNVIVHHVNGKHNNAYYQNESEDSEGSMIVWDEIEEHFDLSKNIYVLVLDISDHIVAYGGTPVSGLAGDLNSHYGKVLIPAFNPAVALWHELGHAFGLTHDSRTEAKRWAHPDTQDPMITSFCAAEWLDVSRYFNPIQDIVLARDNAAQVKMLKPTRGAAPYAIRIQFEVTDVDGLHHAQLNASSLYDSGVIGCKKVNGKASTIEFVTTRVIGGISESVQLRLIDRYGNFTNHSFPIDITNLLPDPKVVSIPDPKLALAVRETLELKPNDAITQLVMRRLILFRASDRQITDLTGLEHAHNVRDLFLDNNQIRDLTPLSGLTELTLLELSENPINDIKPLTKLKNLSRLECRNAQIRDITPIARLTSLRKIDLTGNPISDIAPLTGLTNLSELHLGSSQQKISDITPLTGLVNLNALVLISASVTDIRLMTRFTQLTYLNLYDVPVNDISHLIGLTKLKSLSLVSCKISDVRSLSELKNLEVLALSDNQISDVTPLAQLVNLKELRLEGNPIKDTKPLHTLLRKNPGVKIYLKYGSEPLPVVLSSFRDEDVNADGVVNIVDLTLVAANFRATGTNAADVNGDGVVNIVDLTLVAAAFGNTAAAPLALGRDTVGGNSDSRLKMGRDSEIAPTRADVAAWLKQARQLNLTDPAFQRGIRVLEQLLAAMMPNKTALLPNYPNPFNPETWIPYQLATPANVNISIYTANGQLVRRLELGHQPIGIYESRRRAAYWDGKNNLGEPVASGLYFYTLTAGEFTATRKMLIRK